MKDSVNKVNYLIAAAGLFISVVMIFVVTRGVDLPARPMVKWSQVESAEKAGEKIAPFLFPVLKESQSLSISGDSNFAQVFFQAFKERAADIAPESLVLNKDGAFKIEVVHLRGNFIEECMKGDKKACVLKTASNKLKRKNPEEGSLWVSLYRYSKDQALLIYF